MKTTFFGLIFGCASLAAQALDSGTVLRHVEQLGSRLALYLPQPRVAYSFEVVEDGTADDPTNEPQALPDGRIVVRAALILACRNEAEFAGMLAHSMAHVGEPQAFPVSFIWTADENLIPTAQAPTQRRSQLEADRLAASAMAQAGFDPTALLAYLDRLQPRNSFRTDRLEALDNAVRELSARGTGSRENFEQVQFKQFQAEVRALTGNPIRKPPSLLHP